MSPRIADLGDMPTLTAGFRPFQPGPPQGPPPTGPGTGDGGHPGPCITTLLDDGDRANAAKLGRLDYLLGEMQHIAGRDGCPAELADLLAQARQVTDLRSAA